MTTREKTIGIQKGHEEGGGGGGGRVNTHSSEINKLQFENKNGTMLYILTGFRIIVA